MVDMLPQPSDGFAWVQAAPGAALVCRALEPFAAHLFSTREWKLGSTAERDAWLEVAAAMEVDRAELVRVRQVHGAAVRHAMDAGPCDADVIVGDDSKRALAIQTADCVPLLIVDRRVGACAAVHAGWRGMVARAPARAIDALQQRFGCRPGDLLAAIGPSIGACCYEVGADVRDAFRNAGFSDGESGAWFSDRPQPSPRNPSMPGLTAGRPAHWFFDGWAAVRDQLQAMGLAAHQIHIAALCTASHTDVLCSYRREGARAGRMAAAIRPRSIER
jgi:YfiH family protein